MRKARFGGFKAKPVAEKVLGFRKDSADFNKSHYTGKVCISLYEENCIPVVSLTWLEKRCKDRLKTLNTWEANLAAEKERLEFELMKKAASLEIKDLLSAASKEANK